MKYTIDTHTEKTRTVKKEGGEVISVNTTSVKGFLVRVDNVRVGFTKTKAEAIKLITKEQANPSTTPGQQLTIERHTQRVRKGISVKYISGYVLKTFDKVVKFSEDKAELVKLASEMRGEKKAEAPKAEVVTESDTKPVEEAPKVESKPAEAPKAKAKSKKAK